MQRETLIGAVAIGRNEGDRLFHCLQSLDGQVARVVYVDSGSTDGSPELARISGIDVVELDMSRPFSAARARNAGLTALLEGGAFDYVQFVDGDCELRPSWFDAALTFLEKNPQAAVACGRRRERFPDASAYNRMCDQEWDTPIGETEACGGDALMRVSALSDVGAFDPSLIAGEEPELCLRLRRAGWTVHRLDEEMSLHDAAITRFSQFSRRMVRSGWAYAEGADRYGAGPERYNMREVRRIWIWAAYVPAFIASCIAAGSILGIDWFYFFAGLGVLAYCTVILRMALNRRANFRDSWRNSLQYGAFLSLARPWQLCGALQYKIHKAKGGAAEIIEYKDAPQRNSV
jgi:glycosyltransferase involved in cell wall biosynthesis